MSTPKSAAALVVLAHPEPTSFAAALASEARTALAQAGWRVTFADLYGSGFDPALSAADFTARLDERRLAPMDEQAHAAANRTFSADLAWHVDAFLEAELVVMVSPLWWFSVPAMMKGWIDRVFANGVAYRYPEVNPWSGYLEDKRAMLVLTASYDEASFVEGRVGTLDAMLRPITFGTLEYTGMQVVPPFVAYAADSVDADTRAGYLAALRDRLAALPRSEPVRE